MDDVWLFLHLIAMAFFVGGQLFLAGVAVPALRRHNVDRTAIREIARRFGVGSILALAVLLVTGAAMASEHDLWSDGALHVKLALVVAIIGLTLIHTRRPRQGALEGVIFLLTLGVVGLGVSLAN